MHVQSRCCIIIPFGFTSCALFSFCVTRPTFFVCFVLCNLKSSYLMALGIINLLTYLHNDETAKLQWVVEWVLICEKVF